MPQSLRSVLGGSHRVKKNRRPARAAQARQSGEPQEDEDWFEDKLTDVGTLRLLGEELTLRDVVQAMRYLRSSMFTPVPATGLHSTRTAEVLRYRASMPPMVTLDHVKAVLASPTKTEREVAELVGKGVLRRVRVARRGGLGEAVMEASHLEGMVRASGVSRATADGFVALLRERPTAQTLADGGGLTRAQADELVKAGFLTSSMAAAGDTLHVRPEDRTTLTSIAHVSRFASGTVAAVGGRQAVHLAGGGGGRGGAAAAAEAEAAAEAGRGLRIAVPGHGRYLQLAEAAVAWLRATLGRTRWGEGPEDGLRARFEGGGLAGRRWREFGGVEWAWVLGQAAGLGVAEVFDTGSVGRGVRALG